MKNILTLILLFTFTFSQAQKIIEKSIVYNKGQYIEMEVKFATNIEVKTWDKPNIFFKAELNTKDDKYQDLFKLDIDKNSNNIYITSKAEPVFKALHEEWNARNPNKKKRYYNTGDIYEFNYVLYVPKNAKFKISSINGSLKSEIIEGNFTADLINGDIEIIKYQGNLDLKTINGEIDLKMMNANLVAETIHGDIYADEKLKFSSTNRHVGQKIKGITGSAKNRLILETINGNMYLRL